jgi:heterotetrameric sarcosine oxidase delta subunit
LRPSAGWNAQGLREVSGAVSFLLACPNCGPRSVYEFRFGGEASLVPEHIAGHANATAYDRRNIAGVQTEWWYHRDGCREWLVATRNTITNEVLSAADAHD